MRMSRLAFWVVRLYFVGFVLLTSAYCLLCYIPFTYNQVVLAGILPWVTTFASIHAGLYWAALGGVAATLAPDLKGRRRKVLTGGFLALYLGLGLMLLFHPLLPGLRNDARSLLWSLLGLVPLLWVGVIDWVENAPKLTWAEPASGEDRRVFRAAWQSSVYLSLLYAAIFYFRHFLSPTMALEAGERTLAILWSLTDHLVIFMVVFVTINLVRAVASLFATPCKAEFFFHNVIALLLVWLILTSLIFPPISFGGARASGFAAALGACLVATNAGLSARLFRPEDGPVASGLALLLGPLTLGRLTRPSARIFSLLVIAVVAFLLAVKTAVMDWNYLLQKLSVLLVWTLTFSSFYAMASQRKTRPGRTAVLLFAAVATLGVYKTLEATPARWRVRLTGSGREVGGMLDSYAGYDISFKLIRDMLTPMRSGNQFYKFLAQYTNIPQSVRVNPVEVNLVQKLTRSAEKKPNIFIFVIDSLRRDYLAPYNPSVNFTPSIAAFAQDSVVMQNAFTRYGATGLSEPSIWVGGMLLHKQYITPFYPMNALQKLLEADGYQSYVSKDSILSVVMGPSPSLIELDQGIGSMNYEFCTTLGELGGKLKSRPDSAGPIFAYTQPQNIHISVINREGRTVPPGESYPGFDAPYASRIKRMDACFGQFVNFLKTSGLYDQTIVILTADHGDSLGEDGRWGHAYTLFPEVVRIPLLIHLPASLQAGLYFNPRSLAFLTDITPSLYYLLGHRPILQNEIFGRPLFTASPEEQVRRVGESFLIASSYGPVYGIIRDDGPSMYVVDGVNYQDYYYTFRASPGGVSEPVTPLIRAENEGLIRGTVMAINRFFKFGEPR